MGDKIIRAIQSFITTFSQTIYPRISKLVHDSTGTAKRFILKASIISGIGSLVLSLLLLFFADQIIKLLGGNGYAESIKVLRLLSFLPFVISISSILGIQIMLNFGYKKAFSTILGLAALLSVIVNLLLVYFFKHIGMAIGVLSIEILITMVFALYLYKKNFFNFTNVYDRKVI